MFSGPDAQLVQDAILIALIALVVGTGLGYAILRRAKARKPAGSQEKSSLEQRVQVLERIATDRSIDLADEIEKLRGKQEA